MTSDNLRAHRHRTQLEIRRTALPDLLILLREIGGEIGDTIHPDRPLGFDTVYPSFSLHARAKRLFEFARVDRYRGALADQGFFDYIGPTFKRRLVRKMALKIRYQFDWRLCLTHRDYAHAKPGRKLRAALAAAARGNDMRNYLPDGSTIGFTPRTYQGRFAGDSRIVWTGADARDLMRVAGLNARCQTCNATADDCTCELDNGRHGTWVRPVPDRIEGVSALGLENQPVIMVGSVGLAVGIELELNTIARPNVDDLARFCCDHNITRKPDGSEGVSIELATSPMREDRSAVILSELWDRLRASDAAPSIGCGLHVHVDATGLTRDGAASLLLLWRTYGPRVWEALPGVRKSSTYCTDTTDRPIGTIEYYGTRFNRDNGYDSDRYVDLNVENLNGSRQTIEFRLFPAYAENPDGLDNSDTHLDLPLITHAQLEACVGVSRAFVRAAIEPSPSSGMAPAHLVNAIETLERNF